MSVVSLGGSLIWKFHQGGTASASGPLTSPRILENDVACRPDVRPSFRSQLKVPYLGSLLYVPREERPGPGKHGDKAKAQGFFAICLWRVGANPVNDHRDRFEDILWPPQPTNFALYRERGTPPGS